MKNRLVASGIGGVIGFFTEALLIESFKRNYDIAVSKLKWLLHVLKGIIAHAIQQDTFVSKENRIVITRFKQDDYQTKGTLQVFKDDEVIFECKTLELPWKDNTRNISRIPSESYKFIKHSSPKFGNSFWILDVTDRSEILIHYGNYHRDTEGCILVGESFFDIDGDGHKDVTNSRKTMNNLYNVVGDITKIIIKDLY